MLLLSLKLEYLFNLKEKLKQTLLASVGCRIMKKKLKVEISSFEAHNLKKNYSWSLLRNHKKTSERKTSKFLLDFKDIDQFFWYIFFCDTHLDLFFFFNLSFYLTLYDELSPRSPLSTVKANMTLTLIINYSWSNDRRES